MSLQVEKLEHNMAKLTVEVAAEDVEKALQAAYLKQRKQINSSVVMCSFCATISSSFVTICFLAASICVV